MPKMLNLGFRGKVQTWWDLWGTWATGAFYGQRVYDIYERMVVFARPIPHADAGTVPAAPRVPARDAASHALVAASSRTGQAADAGVLVAARPLDRPVELDRARRARAARRARPGSRAGRGSRRGSGARRGRSRGAGSGRGARRSGTGRRTRARRGSPTPPRTRPCRRRAIVAARRARRRASRCAGCTRRDASSARSPRPRSASPPGRRAATRELVGKLDERDDRARDRVAGRVGARGPQQREEELQLLVGELRADPRRRARACTTTESMSSAGCARFSAISAVPYSNIAAAGARATSSVVSNASRSSLKSKPCSIHSNSWWRSASGMPIRMQIACIGSSPATSTTKSHSPRCERGRRRARRRAAAARLRAARSCAASGPCSRAAGRAGGAGRPSC